MVSLDYSAYPHILDLVIESADHDALKAFRPVCKYTFDRVNSVLFRHVRLDQTIVLLEHPYDYTTSSVNFTTPEGKRIMPSFTIEETVSCKASWDLFAPGFKHTRILDLKWNIYPPMIASVMRSMRGVLDPEGSTDSGGNACAESTTPAPPKHLHIRHMEGEVIFAPSHDAYLNRNFVLRQSLVGLDNHKRHPSLRIGPSTVRFSQFIRGGVLARLGDCENVLYLSMRLFDQEMRDALRASLVGSLSQDRFSLTVVALPFSGEPSGLSPFDSTPPLPAMPTMDEFLNAVCGVAFDPEALEQVQLLKERNTIRLVPLETYLSEHLDTVISETGLDMEGITTVEQVKHHLLEIVDEEADSEWNAIRYGRPSTHGL